MLPWLTAPPPKESSLVNRSIVFWSRLKMNAASGWAVAVSLPKASFSVLCAPLAEIDWTTVYGSGPKGYSDYPALHSENA